MTDDDKDKMSLFDTAKSVFSAMLGVQSKKNATRDFSKGKASHFIIVGVFAGALFVGALIIVVNVMLSQLA